MVKERIYRSSNGDAWDLIREGGEAYVEQSPNLASGGAVSLTPLSDSLQIAPHSAEHLALLALLGPATKAVPQVTSNGFTVQQAVAAQDRLRAALGLPPEVFPVPAFISMTRLKRCVRPDGPTKKRRVSSKRRLGSRWHQATSSVASLQTAIGHTEAARSLSEVG